MVKLGSRIPLWRFTLVLAVPTIVAVLLAHYFSPQQKGALGLAYLFVVAVIGAHHET